MTLLITGSSGFIGSALIGKLRADGHTAHGIDIRSPRWRATHRDDLQLDITDAAALHNAVARIRPQRIVHLAARTDLSADRVIDYHANIEGVANLLNAARSVGCVTRVLWTSTQLISRVGRIPAHDIDFDPDTSYGESKVVGERIVRSLDGGGMEWAILRPTTVWGPGMSDHYLSLLRYLERRRYFHAGDRPTPKSYSYICNAVHQIKGLLEAPTAAVHRNTFYIADDRPIDMRSWCDALSAALGARASPVVPIAAARLLARCGDVLNATIAPGFKFNSFRLRNIMTPYVFDTTNLQVIVGPLPYDNLASVNATVDWYRNVARHALEARA